MKPLELTIYPKMGSVYYDDEANCTWSESMVYGLSVEKRLTDAELAAEYWEHRYGNEVASGWASDYSIIKQASERLEVIGRFARLPHYDEVSL